MIYYDGYGYNFYYGQYGYYEYSVNDEESSGWVAAVFVPLFFCCAICIICFLVA